MNKSGSNPHRPILLATDDSNDVFTFWRYHKQCRIQNRLEVVLDGEEVLRYLAGNQLNHPQPALLVAALNLPRMGGMQLLEHLMKARHVGFSKVLLIDSKEHNLDLVMSAYPLGAHAFLMRPLVKKEFCGLMSRCDGLQLDGCLEERGPNIGCVPSGNKTASM